MRWLKSCMDRVPVGMCLERSVEGKAIEELGRLLQIISGNNEYALEIAQRFLREITLYIIPMVSMAMRKKVSQ